MYPLKMHNMVLQFCFPAFNNTNHFGDNILYTVFEINLLKL